eukprot:1160526-Pelagomonas_calceolata.AAC.7
MACGFEFGAVSFYYPTGKSKSPEMLLALFLVMRVTTLEMVAVSLSHPNGKSKTPKVIAVSLATHVKTPEIIAASLSTQQARAKHPRCLRLRREGSRRVKKSTMMRCGVCKRDAWSMEQMEHGTEMHGFV